MIEFDRVSKRYAGGRDALINVSFTLHKGQMALLTGHSGAGKSTALKLIAGMEHPSGGTLSVLGRNLARLPRSEIPYFRRSLGIVFQDNRLLADRTVFDNVALPLVVAGTDWHDTGKRVRAALDMVGLLGKETLYPLALSGGEQQRVGIARALANRPALLIADEPTGNLDPELADQVLDLFTDFHHHGMTVLVATHDLRHIRRLHARVIALRDGALIHDSSGML